MAADTATRSDHRIPDDLAATIISPKSYADDSVIYPALKQIRNTTPVGLAEVPGYDPLWIITKHADLIAVERNAKLFHSGIENPILNDQANDAFIRSMNNGTIRSLASLTFMDPPEHGLYRNLTSNWFFPNRIATLADQIREIARASVETLMSFDGECDFVKDFALLYPLRVVMTLIGVPSEDEPRMLKLTQEFFGTQDPEEQREGLELDPLVAAKQWKAAIEDLYGYFRALSEARRIEPRDDVISLIANARINGEYVPDAEANGYYVALATAGHDTTSSTSAGGMYGMIKHPDQFARLKNSPELSGAFVEEALRWACPVKHFMRSATADTELRGVQIRKGERLFLSYPSANRDEDVFDRPDDFVIDRKPNRQVAFGYGPHMCLGQHLARLEIKILFEELMPRLKSVELAGDPKWVQANFVGGLKSLPIRFTKA